MNEDLTQYKTGSDYTQMLRTYVGASGVPRLKFGDALQDDRAALDTFREVVGVFCELPDAIKCGYHVEHFLFDKEGAKTRITAPNGNFVEVQVFLRCAGYTADINYKDVERGRTRSLKIVDPSAVKKRAKKRKTTAVVAEKKQRLLEILGLPA